MEELECRPVSLQIGGIASVGPSSRIFPWGGAPVEMTRQVNPFYSGNPISNPTDFVGRKELIEKISTSMMAHRNVSLHGERRTGKTSLLLYLAHPDSPLGLPPNHVPVFFNFEAHTKTSTADVWQQMAKEIVRQIKARGVNGQVASEHFPTSVTNPSDLAEGFVSSDIQITLLLDEFDQTAENSELGNDFYSQLRSLPQRTDNKISFVIATRLGLTALQHKYSELSSPLFNIFTPKILSPFGKDEVYDLIYGYFERAHLNMALAQKLCDESAFLFDLTGYHPFFLQLLCYHLCNELDAPNWPRGEARHRAVQAFVAAAEPHFNFYWQVLDMPPPSIGEREVIERLATDQTIDRYAWESILKRLEERCLAVRDDSGWRLFSSAFATWVREKQLAAWYEEGVAHLTAGDLEQARESFDRILQRRPDYRDVSEQMAQVARKIEDRQLAAWYEQARALAEAGKLNKAMDLLQQIQERRPGYKDVPQQLANLKGLTSVKREYGVNPYRYGPLVTDPDMFFGRKEELDNLYARLRLMQSTSIVGLRRIGKSSLLYRLAHTLRDTLGANYVPLYFDLQDARCRTVTEFVQLVAQKLNEEMGGILAIDEVTDMSSFTEVVERLSKSIHLVLCLDEFEEIMECRGSFGNDFLEALRSLGNQTKLAMVTASRRSLPDLIQAAGWGSPFDNIFSQIDLGLLETYAAQALRRTPFARTGIALSPEDKVLVEQLAGRHPFFLQMACHHLYTVKMRWPGAPADEQARDVRQQFENEAGTRFDKLWEELDEHEKAALKVTVGRAVPTDETRKTLGRLARLGIVEAVDGQWRVFSQSFASRVQQYPVAKKAIQRASAKPSKNVVSPAGEKPPLSSTQTLLVYAGAALVVIIVAAIIGSLVPPSKIPYVAIITAIVLVFVLVGVGKLTGQDFLGFLKNLIGRRG
ncbi:MAG: AAA family ATPase [Chloroflexota bacterium]